MMIIIIIIMIIITIVIITKIIIITKVVIVSESIIKNVVQDWFSKCYFKCTLSFKTYAKTPSEEKLIIKI